MDCINLKEEMAKAKRNTRLFGTDTFRSWLLYFVPGDGTDMHFHASPVPARSQNLPDRRL